MRLLIAFVSSPLFFSCYQIHFLSYRLEKDTLQYLRRHLARIHWVGYRETLNKSLLFPQTHRPHTNEQQHNVLRQFRGQLQLM